MIPKSKLSTIFKDPLFEKKFASTRTNEKRMSAILSTLSIGTLWGLRGRVEYVNLIKKSLSLNSSDTEPELWLSCLVSALFSVIGGLGMDIVMDLVGVETNSFDMSKIIFVDFDKIKKSGYERTIKHRFGDKEVTKRYLIMRLSTSLHTKDGTEWFEIKQLNTEEEKAKSKMFTQSSYLYVDVDSVSELDGSVFALYYDAAYSFR